MSEARRRVLFVDDEPAVLEGLMGVLRPERKRWAMRFASSGDEALSLLAEEPADVVVSDMRMPGMDGAQLLGHVREGWPEAARIVLSGYADPALVARASAVAHQHLLKPCDADVLRRVIDRACTLVGALGDPALRRVVGGLGALPASPGAHARLHQLLAEGDPALEDVGEIVQRDPALAARLLQFVNSPYYGLSRPVLGLDTAAVQVSLGTLRHLAGTIEPTGPDPELDDLARHSRLVAAIARAIAPEGIDPEAAYAAGLLHDAGDLVLLARAPSVYAGVMAQAQEGGVPLLEAERATFGATHAELGAHLLALWGLPQELVDAVAWHHHPRVAEPGAPPLAALVAAANVLSREDGRDAAGGALSLEALAGERAPWWRAEARRVRASLLETDC